MDRIHTFIYKALTGIEPDDRLHNVKFWWANFINPSAAQYEYDPVTHQRKAMDKDVLNGYRFQNCLAFITAKQLALKTEYKNLINSGALEYLCQTTIELRQLANHHAHEIDIDMCDFREVLHMTKATRSDLCNASEFVSIDSIVEFLMDVEVKK